MVGENVEGTYVGWLVSSIFKDGNSDGAELVDGIDDGLGAKPKDGANVGWSGLSIFMDGNSDG